MCIRDRDSKGRILHTGESQRTDGKYLYKYVDAFGNTKYVDVYKRQPTNHLDVEGRRQMADYLKRKRGFILVSHDRYLLEMCIRDRHYSVCLRNASLQDKQRTDYPKCRQILSH